MKSVASVKAEEEIGRILALLEDQPRCRKLLQTTGDEAQKWLNLLQAISESPGTPTNSRSLIFKLMLQLSKRSGLCPQCLAIGNVKKLGDHPVDWGGFGDVWKGKIGEQVVCLKVVKVYLATDTQQLVKEYMREAIVWQQLRHPNLLPFLGMYYLGEAREQLCLVSPWMDRGNLIRFLKETPRHLVKRHSLARDVAAGLSHLHSMKIAHGDLKGLNVLVMPDERACIGDFGLARIADSHAPGLSSSMSGSFKGTIRWLAPELLRSDPPNVVSTKSDIYAFGCVCYEIFASRVPFYELNDGAVIVAVLLDKKHPSRSVAPGLPEIQDSMWEMMLSCWNTDPKSRPTAADLLSRLGDVGQGNEAVRDWTDSIDQSEIRNHVKYPTIDVESIIQMWRSLGNEDEAQPEPDRPNPSSPTSISFQQECEQLKSRLLRLHDFDCYYSFSSPKDAPSQLLDLFSQGTPLCHIFDLLPNHIAHKIRYIPPEYLAEPYVAKTGLELFIRHLHDIVEHIPGVELFTVDDLWSRSSSVDGLKKVTKTVKAILDFVEEDGTRNIAQELVCTDQNFVEDMERFQQYAAAVLKANILKDDDPLHLLLSYVDKLLRFQQRFLQLLEANAQRSRDEQRWGEAFLQCEYDFLVYASYSKYYQAAMEILRVSEDKLSAFNHLYNVRTEVPAFITRPISRVCKYPLILNHLLKYSTSHPYFDELKAGAEAAKRNADRIREFIRGSENAVITHNLKTRVEDWKGIPVDKLGKLLLEDVFTVTRKDSEREYHVFLYEGILLCCGEVSSSVDKSKRNRIPVDLRSKKGKLALKGRIYLRNITELTPLTSFTRYPGSRTHYPLAIWWKAEDDNGLDYLVLHCRRESRAREWETALGAAITAVHLQATPALDDNSKDHEEIVKVKVHLPNEGHSSSTASGFFPQGISRWDL
ncbi:hypothetical protein E1B28_011806 [Marasmius oreades]|uniref:Uncharacterized protein n=1 Tax=Marasmius oreades TaxID=181124 RepID=A0A9P7RVH2_9AGAR|nr:uncharacterized protein E1B28_011806 [Marasmius oreades]KAG7090203.1 hypothetical protein E1B28_011806 [Marasmius oreades]